MEYAAIAPAQGASLAGQALRDPSGFVDGAQGATDAPLTIQIGQRLNTLGQVLGASEEMLAAMRSRLFGPWPQNSTSAEKGRPSSGVADDTLALLDLLILRAVSVSDHAAVLNSRI